MAEGHNLIVLVADPKMEEMLRGILSRHQRIGCHLLQFDIVVHGNRDPGVWKEGDRFLVGEQGEFSHALVLLDREFGGTPNQSSQEMEADLKQRLIKTGWDADRCEAIVIDPELETWIWNSSLHVAQFLGWDTQEELRVWLSGGGWLKEDETKPAQPKEAFIAGLRRIRKKQSRKHFKTLTMKVSLKGQAEGGCTDPAFNKLLDTLRRWFPSEYRGATPDYIPPLTKL